MPSFKISQLPDSNVVDFSVIEALYESPFPGQRSHRLHLQESEYLENDTPLWGDQLVFHSIRYRVPNGKRFAIVHNLGDGYTRVLTVREGNKPRPKKVRLLTHTVATYEEAYALYCQFNNVKAGKKSKHFVQGGIRKSTQAMGKKYEKDAFGSHLMLKGPVPSGIAHSGIPGADPCEQTCNAFTLLEFLDKMNLRKTPQTSAGLMAAFIAIIERDMEVRPSMVKRFIRGANSAGDWAADELRIEDEAIALTRACHAARKANAGFSGGGNVKVMRDDILCYYQYYVELATVGPGAELRTGRSLGDFKAAM